MTTTSETARRLQTLGTLAQTLQSMTAPEEPEDVLQLLRILAAIEAESHDLLERVAVRASELPLSITDISDASGVQRAQVYRWKKKFLEEQGPDLFEGIDRDDSVPSDWRD